MKLFRGNLNSGGKILAEQQIIELLFNSTSLHFIFVPKIALSTAHRIVLLLLLFFCARIQRYTPMWYRWCYLSLSNKETEAHWIFLPSFPDFIQEVEWLVCVKTKDPILPDHQVRHADFSGQALETISSVRKNHTLFPNTWALCLWLCVELAWVWGWCSTKHSGKESHPWWHSWAPGCSWRTTQILGHLLSEKVISFWFKSPWVGVSTAFPF